MQNNTNNNNMNSTQFSNYQQNFQNTQLNEYSKSFNLLNNQNQNLTNFNQDQLINLYPIQGQIPKMSQGNLQSMSMPSITQIARSAANLPLGYGNNLNAFQMNLNSQGICDINNNQNFTQIANNNNNINNLNGIINSNNNPILNSNSANNLSKMNISNNSSNQIPTLNNQTQYTNAHIYSQLYTSSDANMKSLNYENFYPLTNPSTNNTNKNNNNNNYNYNYSNNYNNFRNTQTNSLNSYSYNNPQLKSQTYPLGDSASVYSGMSGSTYFSNAKSVNNLTRKVMKDEVNTRLLACLDGLLPKLAEECAEYIYDKFKQEFSQQNSELEEIRKLVEKLEENFSVKIETKFLNEKSTPMKNLLIANENISIIQKNLERKIDFFITEENKKKTFCSIELLNADKESVIPKEMVSYAGFFGEIKQKINGFKRMLQKEQSLANEINKQIIDGNAGFIQVKKMLEDKIPLICENFELLKSRENRVKEFNKSAFAVFQNENENEETFFADCDKNKEAENENENENKNRNFSDDNPFDASSFKVQKEIKNKKYNFNSRKNEATDYEENLKTFNNKLSNLLNNYSALKNQITCYIQDKNNTNNNILTKTKSSLEKLNSLSDNNNNNYNDISEEYKTEEELYAHNESKQLKYLNKQKLISKEIKFSDFKNPFLATKKCIENDPFKLKPISVQKEIFNSENNFSIPLARKQTNSYNEEVLEIKKKPNFKRKPQEPKNINKHVDQNSPDFNFEFENNFSNNKMQQNRNTSRNPQNIINSVNDNNKNKVTSKNAFNSFFNNNVNKQDESNENIIVCDKTIGRINNNNKKKGNEKVGKNGFSHKIFDCAFKF